MRQEIFKNLDENSCEILMSLYYTRSICNQCNLTTPVKELDKLVDGSSIGGFQLTSVFDFQMVSHTVTLQIKLLWFAYKVHNAYCTITYLTY